MESILTKIFKKLRIIIFLVIISFSFFPLLSMAQGEASLGLSVSPQIFELEVFPGEKITKEINLKNLGQMPVPILVKITDFTALDNSGEMELDESLSDPIIASRKWFKIEKPNFILEETKKIVFDISVPKDAEPGGHYSIILFEPQLPSFYFEPGKPRTIPVIGVLFMISVKTLSSENVSLKNPIEIVEFRIPDKEKMKGLEGALASIYQTVGGNNTAKINIVEKSPSSFFLRIKNNDIFHKKISGKILIYNFFGKKVGEGEIKKTTILPGKTREFPADVSQKIPDILNFLPASISGFLTENTMLGKYRVVLELEKGEGNIELGQSIYFWAIPWKITIIFSLSFLFILLTRKRLVAAVKVLFKPEEVQ